MKTLRYLLVALLLLTLLFLLGGHALAASYTVPRDVSGTPAAECAFIGSTGSSTLCSATDPLPTVNVGTTPAPTTPSTDPTGWAQQWFTGTNTGATGNAPLFPIFLADNTAVGFVNAEAGVTVDQWVSSNKGRTWTKKATYAFGTEGWNLQGGILLSDGAYLLFGNTAQALPGTTGMGRLNANGTTSVLAPVGIPAGLIGGGISAAAQGNTVGLIWVRGIDSEAFWCKSTDLAITWACDATNYSLLPVGNGKAVDSPAPNIWIRATADGVQRSSNNGSTFSTVLSGVAGSTLGVVECISATVCLYTNGQDKIYRSTNAGATWALQFVPPANPLFAGFIDYGSGAVAAVPSTSPASIYFSRDSGASWTPAYTLSATNQRCASPCQTAALDGNAMYGGPFPTIADKIRYSPSVGAGTTILVGVDGTPIAVDSLGRITANQGVGPTLPSGGFFWTALTNGTTGVGSGGVALQVAPIQGTNLLNSSATGAANTAVVATLASTASSRAHLYSLAAFCSAGSATLTILDGATQLWVTPAGTVTTTLFSAAWPVGLTGTFNQSITVTLSTCGVGNTGTLSVQGDQY